MAQLLALVDDTSPPLRWVPIHLSLIALFGLASWAVWSAHFDVLRAHLLSTLFPAAPTFP
jgi:hypothetical protein